MSKLLGRPAGPPGGGPRSFHKTAIAQSSASITHKCSKCSREFFSESNLTIHLLDDHGILPSSEKFFDCSYCPRKFLRADLVTAHQNAIHFNFGALTSTEHFAQTLDHIRLSVAEDVLAQVQSDGGQLEERFCGITLCDGADEKVGAAVQIYAATVDTNTCTTLDSSDQEVSDVASTTVSTKSTSQQPIKCELCKKMVGPRGWENHVASHRHQHTLARKNQKTCKKCDTVPAPMKPPKNANPKVTAKSKKNPFCESCGVLVETAMKRHLKTHRHIHRLAWEKQTICGFCGKKPGSVSCEICNVRFETDLELEEHCKTKLHQQRKFVIDSAPVPHPFIRETTGMMTCTLCKRKMKLSSMKQHILSQKHQDRLEESQKSSQSDKSTTSEPPTDKNPEKSNSHHSKKPKPRKPSESGSTEQREEIDYIDPEIGCTLCKVELNCDATADVETHLLSHEHIHRKAVHENKEGCHICDKNEEYWDKQYGCTLCEVELTKNENEEVPWKTFFKHNQDHEHCHREAFIKKFLCEDCHFVPKFFVPVLDEIKDFDKMYEFYDPFSGNCKTCNELVQPNPSAIRNHSQIHRHVHREAFDTSTVCDNCEQVPDSRDIKTRRRSGSLSRCDTSGSTKKLVEDRFPAKVESVEAVASLDAENETVGDKKNDRLSDAKTSIGEVGAVPDDDGASCTVEASADITRSTLITDIALMSQSFNLPSNNDRHEKESVADDNNSTRTEQPETDPQSTPLARRPNITHRNSFPVGIDYRSSPASSPPKQPGYRSPPPSKPQHDKIHKMAKDCDLPCICENTPSAEKEVTFKTPVELPCETCDCVFTNTLSYEKHLKSHKHAHMVAYEGETRCLLCSSEGAKLPVDLCLCGSCKVCGIIKKHHTRYKCKRCRFSTYKQLTLDRHQMFNCGGEMVRKSARLKLTDKITKTSAPLFFDPDSSTDTVDSHTPTRVSLPKSINRTTSTSTRRSMSERRSSSSPALRAKKPRRLIHSPNRTAQGHVVASRRPPPSITSTATTSPTETASQKILPSSTAASLKLKSVEMSSIVDDIESDPPESQESRDMDLQSMGSSRNIFMDEEPIISTVETDTSLDFECQTCKFVTSTEEKLEKHNLTGRHRRLVEEQRTRFGLGDNLSERVRRCPASGGKFASGRPGRVLSQPSRRSYILPK